MSVIHIPPSLDKPHVIRHYVSYNKSWQQQEAENCIFVRNGTNSVRASKYDIELMFYDRKNITPEYDIHCSFHRDNCEFSFTSANQICFLVDMTIENLGRRPLALSTAWLTIDIENDKENILSLRINPNFAGTNLIVRNGEIWNGKVQFFSAVMPESARAEQNRMRDFYNSYRRRMHIHPLEIRMANGSTISARITGIT